MDSRSFRALVALLAFVLLTSAACGGGTTVVVSEGRVGTADPTPEAGDPAAPAPDSGDAVQSDAQGEEEVAAPAGDDVDFQLGGLGDGEGSDAGGTPTGAARITDALAATEQAARYRYEVTLSMHVSDGDFEIDLPSTPFGTGAVSGTSEYVLVDLTAMFDGLFASVGGGAEADFARQMFGDDLTMETLTDGSTMYVRAPFLAAMASGPAGAQMPPAFQSLEALADGWGVVDLASLGDFAAGDVAGLAGVQGGSSPDQILAVLGGIGSEVTDLGRTTVRDVETSHLRALVDISALLESQGMDMTTFIPDASALDVDLPIDVFVDDDGRVRRVAMTISMDALRGMVPDVPAGAEFEMTSSVDLYDFGADIEITPPAKRDIVGDFTDTFRELAALGG